MNVPWWGVLPFAMLLGCIATFPLLRWTRSLWHHVWFQLLVALLFGLPMGVWMWAIGHRADVVHALVEYVQFITLLFSLFVVSGGVFVAGDIEATPRHNVTFLGIGAVLASLVGTTGAAMLLIRPLLNTNAQRRLKVHTVVFSIFIIANCGGLLTPLGDPPLFLGMLRGVPFLWTLHLLPEWLFTNGLLLLTYYSLDRRMYARESAEAVRTDKARIHPIGIVGRGNLALLASIVAAVALVPSVDLHAVEAGQAGWTSMVPWREMVMLAAAAISFRWSDRRIRFERNKFTWTPILEVAALFVGIFLAMTPALKVLRQVAPALPLSEVTFFVFAGGLSSVLDNAPTYATFFEMAQALGGEPAVAGVREPYLAAISLGAVFCGAVTYIGNGPNFMVKSIAEAAGVSMPSFGGYTLRWAFRYLVPVLASMAMVFIVQDAAVKAVGIAIALARVSYDLWQARRVPMAGPPTAAGS